MRGRVDCPHCGGVLFVETRAIETMSVEPLPREMLCSALPPTSGEYADAPRVPCRLASGHGGCHRSETDTVVWEPL
jgi:hypothetical protein